ncbi:MAG: hypothetical protein HW391_1220, partial [Chloroflexi bacterium]|nr:hypothetical protein [Chloroflexota bacterium]
MKRQAGSGSAGTDPTDAMDVISQGATGGPAGYASASDLSVGGAELLEDRTVRIRGGRHGRRFGISVPGAVIGTFLISALALGAAFGPLAANRTASDTVGNGSDTAITEPIEKIDGDRIPGDEPVKLGGPAIGTEPDKAPGPDATDKWEAADAPAPDATTLDIGLALEGT